MTADAVGGIWHYAIELAEGYSAAGIETVLAVAGPAPADAHLAASATIHGLTIVHQPFRLEWMQDGEADIARTAEWLLDLEREYRPDIVHLNGFSPGALSWRAPHLVVAHSCSLSWWSAVRRTAPPDSSCAYSDRVAAGLRGADLVVAPSAAFLQEVERLYGELPVKQIIWNGRKASCFHPADKEPYIFTAGRLWDEAKNLAAIDAIAASLSWPVFAAGDAQAPDGGVPELSHIGHLGNVTGEQVREWLSRASLFVLPARYEPFGLAVLEAAMSGCALVLGNIPTFRELWDGAACFVDPEDHEGLKRSVQELIANPLKRERLADQALARSKRYGADRMVQAYLDAYAGLTTTANAAVAHG